MSAWPVAVIALAAAVVALGVWVIVERDTSATAGLAPPEVAAMLEDRLAALNSGDAEDIAAFYAPHAVLEERDVAPAVITRGSEQIGERIGDIVTSFGMQLESASPVIEHGDTVAEATSVPGQPDFGFILVYKLDPSGKIERQWVLPAG